MLPKVCAWITVITFSKIYWILPMHSNVTIKNVSWPHFSWPTLYILTVYDIWEVILIVLTAILNFLETQLSDHKSNHSIGFLVHEKLKYRAKYKVSRTNAERGMTISRILVRCGGHLGFMKKPPDKILHTLWKLSHKTFIDSNHPFKKVCTTFPPSRSYSYYSSWLKRQSRDATAASVVETTHRRGLFHQPHFLLHKQTSYTKYILLVL